MQPIQAIQLNTFLPLERMQQELAAARASYAQAKPFPHIVFDNFFDPAILAQVLGEFPQPGAIRWQRFDNEQEIKLASAMESSFGPVTRLLMYHLNSMTFLDWVGEVTGISDLIPDPGFEGGGLHQIVRGGKLGVHADFNKHRRYNLDRRLNLLLYLNQEWREEYGGHLELWNRDMSRCEAKVLPLFNRVMVFSTTDFTYHGHPTPLGCPEGMTRKSLALYYFTNGRPAEETSGAHSTLFRARDANDFKPTLSQRVRRLGKDLLPPLIARQFRRSSDNRLLQVATHHRWHRSYPPPRALRLPGSLRRRPTGHASARPGLNGRRPAPCWPAYAPISAMPHRAGWWAVIPRTLSILRHRYWSVVTGADIPLNCRLGGGLLLPHPNGIVIHPDAEIGPNCLLFQQVTVGMRDGKAPKIDGHVDIGAGAKIIGGVKIGRHAQIGANAVVLYDVPEGATAVGVPAKIVGVDRP